ncbi:hypothetical protein C0989_001363 [Termitomyces sp. Mn162]|nr:hypothetical protein C0989_001363 [Termitomyces sp. Mn162]
MASHPVYTTLNVPTVTSYPSVRCLQWSSDGQACFATKTAAYIMTPDHGVHFDASSVIKSVKERKDHEAWGAVSLGSIDVALWDVTFSPSGLSPDSGCILAGLTSNMDLTLWTASKNCLKGEWIKTVQALNSQTTSMTWSRQADFGLTPTPPVDGSLLIVGNRAGSLVFLRCESNIILFNSLNDT